jgi:hypothetical protein
MFLTLAINKNNGRALVINQEGSSSDLAVEGVPLRVDRKNPFKFTPTTVDNSSEVKILDKSATIPAPRINAMMTGPPESFRHEIGFTDPDYAPTTNVVALWLDYKDGFPRMHEFLVGGPPLEVSFTMELFFGHDEKLAGRSDTEVKATQDTSLIKFRIGSSVSEWMPIEDRFQDSLTSPGAPIQWSQGGV